MKIVFYTKFVFFKDIIIERDCMNNLNVSDNVRAQNESLIYQLYDVAKNLGSPFPILWSQHAVFIILKFSDNCQLISIFYSQVIV